MNARRSLFYSLCLCTAFAQSTLAAATWTGAYTTSPNWIDPNNWGPGIPPNGPNTTANFPSVLNRVVVMVSPVTVGTLNYTSGDNYTIQGSSALTLDNSQNPAEINATNGGTNVISSDLILNSHLIITQAPSGSFTLSGNISGSPVTPALALTGGGDCVLSGTNTYSGGTNISAGHLILMGSGSLSPTGAVSVSAGATFDISDLTAVSTRNIGGLSGPFGSSVTIGPNNLTFSPSDTAAFEGSITGTTGAITMMGTGTEILTGANNYSGGTTVSTGTLQGNASSLQGTITNNAILVFDQTTTGTFLGTINGSGAVHSIGSSTLTLSGTNTYFGGTTVSAGTLQGDTASLQGNITNNATVVFTSGGTYSSSIGGSGVVFTTGATPLTLTKANTYSGGTNITAGTLNLSITGSLNPAGSVNVVAGATFDISSTFAGAIIGDLIGASGSSVILGNQTLTFGTSDNTTFAGVISSAPLQIGSIIKEGSGTVILTGVNTYPGGTTINAGTLSVSMDSNLGGASGLLTFSGGALEITGGSFSSPSRPITLSSPGTIIVDSGSATLSGSIGGSGSLITIGPGTLILTAANNYMGGTFINAGTLSLSGAGSLIGAVSLALDATFDISLLTPVSTLTIGDLSGSIGTSVTLGPNNLTFSPSDTAIFAGSITGGGSITMAGTGTEILTGTNNYSGGTTVFSGTLQGNAASLKGTILDNANLVFDQTGAGTYAGSITGSGTLVTQGSGSLKFTGASNLPGQVTVASGALFINGTLGGGGPMTVSPGATLGGRGTITKDVTVQGILSPGNSVDILNLVGAQTLAPGSRTDVEILPTTSDFVNVTGTMTIQPGAALRLVPLPGIYPTPMTRIIILTTGGVTGTFSTVTSSIPLFLGNVTYTPLDVLLTVTPKFLPSFLNGLSGNNLIFANYITNNAPSRIGFFILSFMDGTINDALESTAPTRNAFSLFAADNNMFYLDTLLSNHNRNARNARRQAYQPQKGRNTAQVEPADIPTDELLTEASLDIPSEELLGWGHQNPRFAQVDPSCEAPKERRFEIWMETFGALAYQKKQHQTPAFNPTTGGAILALDGKVSNRARIGTGAAYTYTYIHEKQDDGHSRINQEYLFLYTTWNNPHWYFDTALMGGLFQIHNVRDINMTGFEFKSESKPSGWQLAPHLEVGYDYNFYGCKFTAEPFVMFDWVNNWQKSYHETGSGPFNAGQKKHYSSFLRSEAGLRFYETARFETWNLTVQEKLSYLNKKPFKVGRVNAFLVGAPGSFTVETLTDTQNLGVAELEFVFQPHNDSLPRTTLEYQGEFGVMYQSHLVSLELTWSF